MGEGFRVDRIGRFPPTFEFTASAALVDGATGLFTSTPFCKSAPELVLPSVEFETLGVEVDVGAAGGLPSLGLTAGAARDSG